MSRKHDHNDKYRRTETCETIHNGVDTRCVNHEKEIVDLKADVKGINQKISATLVFSIATLIALIIGFVTGRL